MQRLLTIVILWWWASLAALAQPPEHYEYQLYFGSVPTGAIEFNCRSLNISRLIVWQIKISILGLYHIDSRLSAQLADQQNLATADYRWSSDNHDSLSIRASQLQLWHNGLIFDSLSVTNPATGEIAALVDKLRYGNYSQAETTYCYRVVKAKKIKFLQRRQIVIQSAGSEKIEVAGYQGLAKKVVVLIKGESLLPEGRVTFWFSDDQRRVLVKAAAKTGLVLIAQARLELITDISQ